VPRVALIVNPIATRLRRPHRERVVRVLAPAGLEWVLPTEGPGDAVRLARWAADAGAEVVVTLGGDGTAADVAGALAGRGVALAPLPAGSTNVFGRAAGWPAELDRAIGAVGGRVASGETRALTLGVVSAGGAERTFCVNAGAGIDAETTAWVEDRPRLKRRLRQGAFVIGATRAGLRRGAALTVRADDGDEVPAATVIAACGGPYAWLATRPLDLVPGAAFDGVLGWLAILRSRPHELARLTGRALRGHDLQGEVALMHGRAEREIVVRAAAPVAVQADGEPLGRHAEVRMRPGPALRLVSFARDPLKG
jgi:diacylglycerol kinase family enzyme